MSDTKCDARVESLEEIVGQQRVVGHAVAQRRHERVDVVEPLAREDALGEQILVRVRHGRRVGIDAGVTRIEPGEQRTRRARECDADARLQNAVAIDHQTGLRIDQWAVQRMRGDADQRARGIARQRRVAVERDAVAHRRQDGRVPDVHDEARVLGAAQQAIELVDLAALALPAHPQAFLRVPLSAAVAQEETIARGVVMFRVERADALARRLQDRGVLRLRLFGGVAEVAQDGEMNVRVQIAERLDLEMREQIVHPRDAVEHRRHDHHRPVGLGHGAQFEASQAPRWNQAADQALQNVSGQLTRRDDRDERDDGQRPASPAVPVGECQCRGDERRGAHRNRAEVAGRRVGKKPPPQVDRQFRVPADAFFELTPPAADEEVPDVRAPVARCLLGHLACALDGFERDAQLRLPGRRRHFLDRMTVAVAAREIHARVHANRIAAEDLLDEADVLEIFGPVEHGDDAKAADEARHERLFGGLVAAIRSDRVFECLAARGQQRIQLAPQLPGLRFRLTRSLEEADDKGRRDVRRPHALRLRRRRQAIGGAPMRPIGGEHVRAFAQVAHERQLEHARPRPQLAHRQGRDRLEGHDEAVETLGVETAGAVADQLRGHRVDPRLTGVLVRLHLRQTAVERGRKIVPDVPGRRRDDGEVVEQPLGGRRGLFALTGVVAEIQVDLAQCAKIAVEPGEMAAGVEVEAAACGSRQQRRQAAGMLFKRFDP